MLRIFCAATMLAALVSNTALAAGDPAAGEIKGYTCTGCHGIPGYKNIYPTYNVPKIGGQNQPYLVSALNAYKSGQRRHGTMNLQAESLSGQDIRDISAWLASIPADGTASGGGDRQAGREKSAPCQACHGENGIGTDAQYPILAGQYQSYLINSLKSYRNGERANAVMSAFATNLSDEDIADLAAWYASHAGLQVLPAY